MKTKILAAVSFFAALITLLILNNDIESARAVTNQNDPLYVLGDTIQVNNQTWTLVATRKVGSKTMGTFATAPIYTDMFTAFVVPNFFDDYWNSYVNDFSEVVSPDDVKLNRLIKYNGSLKSKIVKPNATSAYTLYHYETSSLKVNEPLLTRYKTVTNDSEPVCSVTSSLVFSVGILTHEDFSMVPSGNWGLSKIQRSDPNLPFSIIPFLEVQLTGDLSKESLEVSLTPSLDIDTLREGEENVNPNSILATIKHNAISAVKFEVNNPLFKVENENIDGEMKPTLKVASSQGLTAGEYKLIVSAETDDDYSSTTFTFTVKDPYRKAKDVLFQYANGKSYIEIGVDDEGKIGLMNPEFTEGDISDHTFKFTKNDDPLITNDNDLFKVTENGEISTISGLDIAKTYNIAIILKELDKDGNSIDSLPPIKKVISIETKSKIENMNISYNNLKNTNTFIYDEPGVLKDANIAELSITNEDPMKVTFDFCDIDGNSLSNNDFILKENKLFVGSKKLSVGTYEFYLKGMINDGRSVIQKIIIIVKAADQTMEWDSDTDVIANKYYGETFTLGIKDLVGTGEIVTYGLNKENTCINLNTTTGQVSITCVPNNPITFTATSSGDINYKEKTIEKVITIKKRPIALKTKLKNNLNSFVDKITIEYGDEIPAQNVVIGTGSNSMGLAGSESISSLGTPIYKFMDGNNAVIDPNLNPERTYLLDIEFQGGTADNYEINVEKAELKVVSSNIIDSEYYTINGKKHEDAADQNWYYDDITITPIHKVFSEMDMNNNNNYTSNAQQYTIEGDNQVTLVFRKPGTSAIQTTSPHIKIDKSEPTVTDITYMDKTRNPLELLLNAITFDHYFNKEQTVIFHGNDTGGSGLDTFEYTIIELDADGNEKISSRQTSKGMNVDLSNNKNYRITVYAIDKAGNKSKTPMIQTVSLSDKNGVLDINAYTNGDRSQIYDGSIWTKDSITIELTNSNTSGTRDYWYSQDGVNFQKMSGNNMMIPNTSNIDNITYTFKAVGNNGMESIKTLQVKLDKVMPDFDITAKSEGEIISTNTNVVNDVVFTLSPINTNISGVSYYYTNKESVSEKDPTSPASGWSKFDESLTVSEAGNHTYYFIAVSGAKAISSVQEFSFTNGKVSTSKVNVNATTNDKGYTEGTWTNHDVTFSLSGGINDANMIKGYEVAVTDGAIPGDTVWEEINNPANFKHTLTENIKDKMFWFRIKDMENTISDGFKVRLDIEKPTALAIDAKGKNDKNTINFNKWLNQEVNVSVNGSDNFTTNDNLRFEYTIGESEDWQRFSSRFILKNGTNSFIRVRAIDEAGNISEAYNSAGKIMIDTEAPLISGITNNGKYRKATVHFEDELSDIDYDNTVIKFNEKTSKVLNDTLFDKDGVYRITVKDKAGNKNEVMFTITSRTDVVEDAGTESKVEGVDTDFDIDTKLNIIDVTDKTDTDNLILDDSEEIKKVYKAELTLGGVEVEANGTIRISIRYQNYFGKMDSIKIYDIKDGIKELTYKIENGYIIFETDRLGTYAFIGDKEEKIEETICYLATKALNIDRDGDGKSDYNIDLNNDGRADLNIGPAHKPFEPRLNIDTDKDDRPDINIDLDGDCGEDLNIDLDGDGLPDIDIDSDGDGVAEINIDNNRDGTPDVNILESLEKWIPDKDIDGKIKYDTMSGLVPRINVDTTGDGKADSNIDSDGDGLPDKNLDEYWKNKLKDQTKSVKGASIVNAKAGVSTGDNTSWNIWLLLLIISAGIMSYQIYKKFRIRSIVNG